MNANLKVEGSIAINAATERVWNTLVSPEKIKRYLFGSDVDTDWRIGSPISFAREYEGKRYVDKGELLEVDKGKCLKFTFFSSQEGYEDSPGNYSTITYTINGMGDHKTTLTFLREHIPIEFERKNQERYLPYLLQEIKKLAEE